jgi:hypothetical protein
MNDPLSASIPLFYPGAFQYSWRGFNTPPLMLRKQLLCRAVVDYLL